MAVTVKTLMKQAQVFASAWSLVDGPFDKGNQLQLANDEKHCLKEMLEEFEQEIDANAAPGNLKEIADGLIKWHSKRISDIKTMLKAEEGTLLQFGGDDDAPIELTGMLLKGFRMALMIVESQLEPFPLSITSPAQPCGEEE